MRKKRINSTLRLRISVLTGGESRSLEGRDIKVFLVDPKGLSTDKTLVQEHRLTSPNSKEELYKDE